MSEEEKLEEPGTEKKEGKEEAESGNKKKAAKKSEEGVPAFPSSTFTVSSGTPMYTLSSPIWSTGTYYSIDAAAGTISVPSSSIFSFTQTETKLDEEIAKLKNENRRLAVEIAAKEKNVKENKKLQENVKQLERHLRLKYLYDRVNEKAKKELADGEELRKKFEETEYCDTVIMSIDIRRSTELMLKAREPKLYADFITNLCSDLTKIIVDNYGVFDKFTGDGLLCFFPEFYSGQDAPYYAIKAAAECHSKFSEHYQKNRKCFKTVLINVGLGIGIDYGKTHLVKMQDQLTVIGEPVVYACRLSGGEAGKTLLNQPAYEIISENYGAYVDFKEDSIEIKHEGPTLAYVTSLSKKNYVPKTPDWISKEVNAKG
ncbi:MAG: adenylate/guanylate cyclase domain-containing protein [Chloroflexi bacterium]|nr:adenylate/guanylate cyclase domain-containing protein [Chloroflexota bacterium]